MVLAELGGKLRESLRQLQFASKNDNDDDDAAATAQLEQRITAMVSEIARALIEADVNVKLVMKVRDNILQQAKQQLLSADNNKSSSQQQHQSNISKKIQTIVVNELVTLVSPPPPSSSSSSSNKSSSSSTSSSSSSTFNLKRGKSNIVLLVGLQGAGKTTTVAKLANYYSKRHYKVGLVCADTFRAGALDQLKQNAIKLHIPFYGSYTIADPVVIAQDGVKQFIKNKYELILVDTSGRHQQEQSLLDEMQDVAAAIQPHHTLLVLDATQGQAVYDQAVAFHHAVPVGGVILTKLDGHAKGGGALSAVSAANAPIVFWGNGEHFDDLELFQAQSFVSKLLGYHDVRGLFQAVQEVSGGPQSQKELLNKMEKGRFTLRDMYQQFQNVLNLGPLNRFMGGAGNSIPGLPQGDQGNQQLRRFLVIMDSMTNGELDGRVDWHNTQQNQQSRGKSNKNNITSALIDHDAMVESRIRRIARGSGCHPNEVKILLQQHKRMESWFVQMGKSGMVGKQAQLKQTQFAQQLKKNPNLINQRINQMDPKLIQQMGGREQVMAMMQQMAKGNTGAGGGGGGMPGFPGMDPFGGGGGGGLDSAMGMPSFPPGGGGMMPSLPAGMDMQQLMKMAQAMGMGGGGGPGGGMGGFGGGGGGGMGGGFPTSGR